MKNIFRIYRRDVKRLTKNVMALIVAIGISIIPALYAWFNIAANWNPYGNTAGIKVAVSNEDEGFRLEAVSLNIGEQIISNLKANDQIGWQFTDTKAALSGVKSGKYYAAVVIPSDFSKKMSSILSSDIERPQIQYYINEKKNAIAPKITDKGVGVIQQQVNATFISEATEAIAGVLNMTTTDLEDKQVTILDRFISSLNTIDTDLAQYEETIDAFISAVDEVNGLVQTTKLALPDVDTALANGNTALADAQSIMDASQTSLSDITQVLGNVLDSSQGLYDSVSSTATDAFSGIKNSVDDAAGKLEQTTSLSQSIIDMNNKNIALLEKLNATLGLSTIEDLILQLQQSNEHQQGIIDKITDTSESILSASNQAAETRGDIQALIKSSTEDLASIRASYRTAVQPSLDSLLDKISRASADLSGMLKSADGSLSNIDGILDGVGNSLASGKDSLSSTKDIIETTRGKIRKLVDGVNSVGEDERISKLLEIIRNDPTIMGDFMSSPVQLDTTSLYSIENYGSAMAPFYSTLAIWVGGIVLVAIMKVRVDEDEKLRNLKPSQCYLGRYLLFLTFGLIQSSIICLGDLFFLEIQCKNPVLFVLAGMVCSLVFTNIIYTLTVSFGDIGKALCVILLVIQIAGAGGTFPIEVTPQFFQNVYPFLPFTYGINAMRETVAGIYHMSYWTDILHLLLFVPFALLLGLVLRKPLIRLNEFFERRLEDTHLM
ncbi:YhgE/Pip domain-containing protein [Lactonifactor longoviformis]|uniref:Putative membrane protein n=1 Tax=Lactonifactor longoviformis DSM 17459 TaxID=1122155 RepID=A0A1M4VMK7_9CLOT|nr:YhgE/Pip domain-containing protein [Lactonifactor longoviformis]SHE70138.1 putative membrane protein [Lactonifactor longoviformis DSM 17459]